MGPAPWARRTAAFRRGHPDTRGAALMILISPLRKHGRGSLVAAENAGKIGRGGDSGSFLTAAGVYKAAMRAPHMYFERGLIPKWGSAATADSPPGKLQGIRGGSPRVRPLSRVQAWAFHTPYVIQGPRP